MVAGDPFKFYIPHSAALCGCGGGRGGGRSKKSAATKAADETRRQRLFVV